MKYSPIVLGFLRDRVDEVFSLTYICAINKVSAV